MAQAGVGPLALWRRIAFADRPLRVSDMSFGVDSRLSILGGVGYPPAHASRYAGAQFGMARLTVKNDCIVISPLWFWRRLLRMPVLRIPLTAIQGASRISWGVKFTVPADAELEALDSSAGTETDRSWRR
jgi:hypothetical protein